MAAQSAMLLLRQVRSAQPWGAHLVSGARRAFATIDPSAGDSHDDFKPKFKASSTPSGDGDVKALIESEVKAHDVFIYMKGVPQQPQCGFSNMACRVLDAYGVKYGARNVLADAAVREGIKAFTSWPTIPQVFVKGEFIGGADILYSMHESGELEKVLGPIIKEQQQKQQ